MRFSVLAAALLLAAVFAVGCGDEQRATAQWTKGVKAANAKDAYQQISRAWKENNAKVACDVMTPSYEHKMAAQLQVFDADCLTVVLEIHKQVAGDDAIKDLSVQEVKGPTKGGSVLVRSQLDDGVVRTRFDFEENDGLWSLVGDRSLDSTGPQEPVKAYRAIAKKKGESPELLWSEVKGDQAWLWEIQGNGDGAFTLREIGMLNEDGTWKVREIKNLGTAPDVDQGEGEVI